RPLFLRRELDEDTLGEFNRVELPDGSQWPLNAVRDPKGRQRDYRHHIERLLADHPGARLFRPWPITNGGTRANQMDAIELGGQTYLPPKGRCWSHTTRTTQAELPGMIRVKLAGRLIASGKSLDYKRYLDDFPLKSLSNWWDGLGGASNPIYV